jgi:hypothetical protein
MSLFQLYRKARCENLPPYVFAFHCVERFRVSVMKYSASAATLRNELPVELSSLLLYRKAKFSL